MNDTYVIILHMIPHEPTIIHSHSHSQPTQHFMPNQPSQTADLDVTAPRVPLRVAVLTLPPYHSQYLQHVQRSSYYM